MDQFQIQPQFLRDTLFELQKSLAGLTSDSTGLSGSINDVNGRIDEMKTFGVRFAQVVDPISAATSLTSLGSGTVQLINRLTPTSVETSITTVANYYLRAFGAGSLIAVVYVGTQFFVLSGDSSKITVYDTAGTTTVTKATGAVSHNFWVFGAGAGGGAGNKVGALTNGEGGGGGGGGGMSLFSADMPTSVLPSQYNVVVGASGTGGAASTADNTSPGASGVAGGDSKVTSTDGTVIYIIANGGSLGVGGNGAGTGVAAGGAGGAGGSGIYSGGAGSAGAGGNNTATSATALAIGTDGFIGAGGGGGGAGKNNATTNSPQNGGAGASVYFNNGSGLSYAGGGLGGVGLNSGAVGSDTSSQHTGGGGGGGGGSNGSDTAGTVNGGNGGVPGGGGGGGGAGKNAVRNGGAGGSGGHGRIIEITNFA
jgi:hypothetical protein